MKMCSRCKTSKPSSAFSKDKRYRDGLQSYCRECVADYRVENKERIDTQIKAAKEANPDKYKDQWMRNQYGISLEYYRELLKNQGGVCAICGTDNPGQRAGKPLSFCVDHDHSCCSGKKSCGKCVRGLICTNCNFGIGSLKDSIPLLQSAIQYIQENTSGR